MEKIEIISIIVIFLIIFGVFVAGMIIKIQETEIDNNINVCNFNNSKELYLYLKNETFFDDAKILQEVNKYQILCEENK